MTAWWSQRSARERWLLFAGLFVGAVAFLFQGILVPSLKARAQAELRLAETRTTLVRLERLRKAGISTLRKPPAQDAAAAAAQAATWADETGLVGRPGASPVQGLQFAFDRAEPAVVFSWIDRVEAELGLSVQSAEIVAAEQGTVFATVAFSGAAAP